MLKYCKSLSVLLLVLLLAGASCKKTETPAAVGPTNLTLNAVISSDGSGKVSFTASADNAVSYTFNFGDENSATVSTGVTEHIYTTDGTNDYTVTVTAKSSSDLNATKSISITVNHVSVLVWSDEFNTDGLPDASKWGYDLGAGGWGNDELEYYTNRAENAVVNGGVLKITAIKENYLGSPYTSARMLSKGKYSFKYGKVEVKAKMPTGVGTWPAIWMLGSNIDAVSWPNCGEIDIMEHLGRDLNKIYATLHYPGRFGGNADGSTRFISNATTEFHIYTLEWNYKLIKMSVDGDEVHSVVNSSIIPFNHEFFFIMNIAMGGNFGGPVEGGFTSSSMEVDYIRVYQ